MDYKDQIEQAKHAAIKWREKHPIVGVGELRVDYMVNDLCRSITDLLVRAEEAEARAEKAEMERNAAVNDLKEEVMGKIWACDYCKKNDPEDFQCKRDDLCGCSEWEWRGQKGE